MAPAPVLATTPAEGTPTSHRARNMPATAAAIPAYLRASGRGGRRRTHASWRTTSSGATMNVSLQKSDAATRSAAPARARALEEPALTASAARANVVPSRSKRPEIHVTASTLMGATAKRSAGARIAAPRRAGADRARTIARSTTFTAWSARFPAWYDAAELPVRMRFTRNDAIATGR